MTIRTTVVACLGLAVAGCASVTPDGGFSDVRDLVQKRADLKLQWNRNTEDDKAAEKAVAGLLAKPLTAAAAVQVGLLNNRGLQAMYAEVGVSQADMVQAGMLSNPVFTGDWVRSSDGYHIEESLTFNFMSLLLLPMRKKMAAAQFEHVKAKVAFAIVDFVADTKAAYYRAVAARQTVAFMERAATSAEAAAELAQRQREAGALGSRELARQVAFSAETQTQLTRARQSAVAERERLLRQLGLAVSARLLLPDRLPGPGQGRWTSQEVESAALDQRLDIEAAKRDLDVAGQAAGITNITRFVNIQAIGVVQIRESGQAARTGPMAEVELPIFDWGSAKTARAQTFIREAQDRLVDTVVRVRSEVRDRLADVETMGEVLKRQQALILPMRERIVKETQLLYNGMLEGVYTLLSDYRDGVMAGRDLIDAQRDTWLATVQLERAAGGRLPPLAAAAAPASGSSLPGAEPAPGGSLRESSPEPLTGNSP